MSATADDAYMAYVRTIVNGLRPLLRGMSDEQKFGLLRPLAKYFRDACSVPTEPAWTHEHPAVPGHYWFFSPAWGEVECVELRDEGEFFRTACEEPFHVDGALSHWALWYGPIPCPPTPINTQENA